MGKNTFKMAEKGFNQNSTENNIYKKKQIMLILKIHFLMYNVKCK